METIVLNLFLVGIILFGTIWWFYSIWTSYDSDEYSTISEKKYFLNDKDIFDIIIDLEKTIDVIEKNQEKLQRNLDELTLENFDLGFQIDPFESSIDYKSMYKKPDYKDARAIRRNIKRLPGEKDHALNVRKQQVYKDAKKWNDEQDRLQTEFVSQKKVEEIMMKLETMKLQNENLKLERVNNENI